MKTWICSAAIVVSLIVMGVFGCGCATTKRIAEFFEGNMALAQNAVPSRVTFVVRDDMGQPVANAKIYGWFGDASNAGAHDGFERVTGTNGILVVKGRAAIDVVGIVTADGCYQTKIIVPLDPKLKEKLNHRIMYAYNERMHHPQNPNDRNEMRCGLPGRWDVEIPVLLKRIRNPIPMFAKNVKNSYLSVFRLNNEPVGYCLGRTSQYDMVKGAFLPPYGQGEVADMEFKLKMTIYSTNSVGRALEYDKLYEIRMTNIADGICRGVPDGSQAGDSGSSYFSDYVAPISGYQQLLSFYNNVRNEKHESNDDNHYLYYFRIRAQTNEMGQVTNALYGKLYGQINRGFIYYLNPTPNGRNVEFDPKRNLFKNLGRLEQVYTP